METNDKNMAALHQILKPIEIDLQAYREKILSPSTQNCYQKIFECLQKRINSHDSERLLSLHEMISDTSSKNTFFTRRAAVEYIILRDIESEIRKFHLNVDQWDPVTVSCSQTEIENLRNKYVDLRSLRGSCQLNVKCPRRSKRSSLKGLPSDWREQIYLRSARGKYGQAIAVAALTGCRPSELVHGVRLEIVRRQNSLCLLISILGAKVTSANGQPIRELSFFLNEPSFVLAILANEVRKSSNVLTVRIKNANAFSMAISRFGKAIWPNHRENLTGYSFRHAAASDLKSVMSDVDVAGCLGHASTRTQKSYGQKQQSRSSKKMIPNLVEVGREIRIMKNEFIEKIHANRLLPDDDNYLI